MLEGEWGTEAPPLARLVANDGARLSGLMLLDGTLILNIENGLAAAQLGRPASHSGMAALWS